MQRFIGLNGHTKKIKMKKVALLILVVFAFSACKKDIKNSELIGKWKLIESLADPGDGRGTWQPSDPSNPKYIEFLKDGTLMFTPSGQYDSERYEITSDSTMTFFRGSGNSTMRYHMSGNLLTLNSPCIEACGSKYIKVIQ